MRIGQEHFKSIHEMLDVIESRQENEVMRGKRASEKGSYDFTATHSYSEAKDLFRNGWEEPLSKIKRGLSKIQNNSSMQRRRVATGVVGYAPHVPNAILGLPNSMILTKTQAQKTKAVSLLYDICECAYVETDEFIRSGIAFTGLVHSLELQGVRVKIRLAFFTSKYNSEYVHASVDLKHYGEHMDLKKMCFPLIHPSMFRRFGFKWLETAPNLKEQGFRHGYGSSFDYSDGSGHKEIYEKYIIEGNEIPIDLGTTKECEYDVNKLMDYVKNFKKSTEKC